MTFATFSKNVVAALVTTFLLLHAPSSANAQTMELCSRLDPAAPSIKGTLQGNPDPATYVLLTALGEITLRRADFIPCAAQTVCPAGQIRVADRCTCPAGQVLTGNNCLCPAGQIAGPNGCACPASQTMKDGRCIAPSPRISAAGPGQCKSFETLRAQGSGTIATSVMPYFIQGFANVNGLSVTRTADSINRMWVYQLQGPDAEAACFRITLRGTGSSDADAALNDRLADTGMSSHQFDDSKIQKITAIAGRGALPRGEVEQVVALDAVVVVVNRHNPIGALSLCQIARIFAGQTRDWRDLGGRPGPISVNVRTGASGTYETFQDLVLKNCGVDLNRSLALSRTTYDALLDAVAADETAIGFAPSALLGNDTVKVKPLSLRGSCGIEQAATSFSIKTEDYPLARRLFLYTPFSLDGYARRFMSFIKTDDRADDALSLHLPYEADTGGGEAQARALDQKIEAASNDGTGRIVAPQSRADPASHRRFGDITAQAERLSLTYRFTFNSEELDTKARQDISRLVRYLQANPTQKTLFLAGFTDDVGTIDANLIKARARADAVRRELTELGALRYVKNIVMEGFGEILPVACNDTKLDQEKNRRVEVWLVRDGAVSAIKRNR